MIAKYQFMEQNLQRRVVGLKDKMPDIQKTLDTVRFLQLRKVRIRCIRTHITLSGSRKGGERGYGLYGWICSGGRLHIQKKL